MPAFPINLELSGRLVVIIGGGSVALRKAQAALVSGARVRVVAPQLCPELRELYRAELLEYSEGRFSAQALEEAFLVFAATDDDAVNASVVALARARTILCSDASAPERGDFTMPAVARIHDITVAVDTGGQSPAFAKRMLAEWQEQFGDLYGRAAGTLGAMRRYVQGLLEQSQRGPVLRELAALPIEMLASLNPSQAEHEVDTIVERMHGPSAALQPQTLICASRASKLALTQTRTIAARLAQDGIATTILTLTTTGDAVQDRPLAQIGAENLFVKELEIALRDGRAHYAVHSCKDLPSTLPPDMALVAIGQRADVRDAFCSAKYETFSALPAGARVGTSSMRRRAQLAALRPDLQYVDVRGNIDTRLRKLADGEYEAIVLAMAGMERLGVRPAYLVPFSDAEMVPAVGQGALAIEMSLGTGEFSQRIREICNHEQTELAVTAERSALAHLRGGCQAPIGLHAKRSGAFLELSGLVAAPNGSKLVRAVRAAPVHRLEDAAELGREVARGLLDQGAAFILGTTLAGRVVLLPRTQDRPSLVAKLLREYGAEVVEVRDGEAPPGRLGERIPDMIVFASSGSVEVARPFLAHFASRKPPVAAMGPSSGEAARAAGFAPDVVASSAQIDDLVTAVHDYLLARPQTINS